VVKGRERRFIMQHRHDPGRSKISISAHLQRTDMNFKLNRERVGVGVRGTHNKTVPGKVWPG
jgi:hypothetical protein